jgi:hypothetical protein
MARVGLYFETKQVFVPQFGNWPMTIIRLMADVQFQLSNGLLAEPVEAIFDTGAPLGVLPRRLCSLRSPTTSSYGQKLSTNIHVSEATFGGISRRKVCQIRCSIGTVRGCLVDAGGNRTCLYNFPAFLARTNRVPVIIGFSGLLEKFRNQFDYGTNEAWVEERLSCISYL